MQTASYLRLYGAKQPTNGSENMKIQAPLGVVQAKTCGVLVMFTRGPSHVLQYDSELYGTCKQPIIRSQIQIF